MKGTCVTCRWARWTMTKHRQPRINKDKPGDCDWPMERLVIPLSVSFGGTRSPWRQRIWADDDNPDCPAWEAKA